MLRKNLQMTRRLFRDRLACTEEDSGNAVKIIRNPGA